MNNYLNVAIEAAQKAEKIIIQHYNTNLSVKSKDDASPVTIADKESEKIIISTIQSYFPNHSILGEESGKKDFGSEYIWIIDPIDGTKNYTRNIPLFGTQIALMKNEEIIFGLSNMPILKEMIYAEVGKGAFLNGKPIKLSKTRQLNESYLAYGSLNYFQESHLLNQLLVLENETLGHRGFGDCWMYHLLTQGKIDIVLEAKVKIWDIAAMSIIISEAGGVITDLHGGKINKNTNSILATHPNLQSQVLDILNK